MSEPESADEGRRLLEASDALLSVEDKELERIRERIRSIVVDALAEEIEEINLLGDSTPEQDARRRADAAWWLSIIQTMSRGLQ